jgi:hypothetical protein
VKAFKATVSAVGLLGDVAVDGSRRRRAATMVGTGSAGDLQKPRARLARLAKRSQLLKRPDEYILRDVFGIVTASRMGQANGQNGGSMVSNEVFVRRPSVAVA